MYKKVCSDQATQISAIEDLLEPPFWSFCGKIDFSKINEIFITIENEHFLT